LSARKNNYRAIVSAAYLEQNTRNESVAKKGIKGFTSPVHIRVISYRKLNHDTDGVSIKAILDGIVQRGILADDSAKQVKSVTFESRKSNEEKTVIEITLDKEK